MVDIIIEIHVNGLLDIFACGAELEGEEDAAGPISNARDKALHVTSSIERHGECVAEVAFARQRHLGPVL